MLYRASIALITLLITQLTIAADTLIEDNVNDKAQEIVGNYLRRLYTQEAESVSAVRANVNQIETLRSGIEAASSFIPLLELDDLKERTVHRLMWQHRDCLGNPDDITSLSLCIDFDFNITAGWRFDSIITEEYINITFSP
jgi:hypothetical protein